MNRRVSTYRKIVSSTAIFGGVQFFNTLVNIVRGRLVAMLIHSTGMGITTLLNNASNVVQQIALMGINVSAVRSISQVKDENDAQALDEAIVMVRRMVMISSVLGFVLMILLSPLLSKMSFGNTDKTFLFVALSISVVFNILWTGEITIMQGLRRYKMLALCSTVPPLAGLLLSIPLYYIWGLKAIVPAIILMSAVYYLVVRRFGYRSRKKDGRKPMGFRTIWTRGHDIIQFGLIMTLGNVLGTITSYVTMAFISNQGSVEDVGFYQAANLVTTQYVGIIFTAMATDYFPHLSAIVNKSMRQAIHLVNQQFEIVLLVVTPIVMLIIVTAPLLIVVFLGSEFQPIKWIVRFIGFATIFKAACFPLDYIAYAKGDKKYIFWVESVFNNVKTITVLALFYLWLGLDGLGYGAVAVALIDVVFSVILTRWRYGMRFTMASVRLFFLLVAIASVCLATSFIPVAPLRYTLMLLTTAAGMGYCLYQLDSRLNLRLILQRMKEKVLGR